MSDQNEESTPPRCPHCSATRSYSNGKSKEGRPRRKCLECHKYWTLEQKVQRVSAERWDTVWAAIHEGLGIRAAARVFGISYPQVQRKYRQHLASISTSISNPPLDDSKKKP